MTTTNKAATVHAHVSVDTPFITYLCSVDAPAGTTREQLAKLGEERVVREEFGGRRPSKCRGFVTHVR